MPGLVEFGWVDRRLAVLGTDDEQRRVEDATSLERLDHGPQGVIGLLKTEFEHGGRCATAVEIAAGLAGMDALRAAAVRIVLGNLLSDAHRLEVHAEYGRGPAGGLAVMREPVDLVDDGLHLQSVVRYRAIHADGRVEAVHVGYFRREKVVYALAGGTVDEIVSRVLVRPGGAAALALDDFEDCVGFDCLMRKYRNALAVLEPPGSLVGSITFWETLPLYRSMLSSNTIMLPGAPLHVTLVGSKKVRS